MTRNVAPFGQNVGQGDMVDSRRYPSEKYTRVSVVAAKKTKNVNAAATKGIDVDAPTDAAEVVRVADAESEGR